MGCVFWVDEFHEQVGCVCLCCVLCFLLCVMCFFALCVVFCVRLFCVLCFVCCVYPSPPKFINPKLIARSGLVLHTHTHTHTQRLLQHRRQQSVPRALRRLLRQQRQLHQRPGPCVCACLCVGVSVAARAYVCSCVRVCMCACARVRARMNFPSTDSPLQTRPRFPFLIF